MNSKLTIVGLIVALALGFVGATKPATVVKTQVETPVVGAVTSPYFNSKSFSFGGVMHWGGGKDSLTSGSATLCSVQAPSATSTLVSATMRVENAAYANTFQVGNADTSSATTTLLGSLTVAASKWGELVATTSVTALTNGVVRPNTYIVFKVATGTPAASFAPSGDCKVVFRQL